MAEHQTTPASTKRPTRRRKVHVAMGDALDFAQAYGLDVRTLCGVWMPAYVDLGTATGQPGPRDCLRCARSMRAIARESGDDLSTP